MKDNKYIKSFNEASENLNISDVSESFESLSKFKLDEIERYLDKLGYSIIKTDELEYLENIVSNHPG